MVKFNQFVLACAFLFGIAKCSPLANKIVGGEPTDLGEFPSMISLHAQDYFSCGASILSEDWVLTAGHCVWKVPTEMLSFRSAGSLHHTEGERHQAIQVITRDDFNNFNGSAATINNDIALVKVDPPFTFGPNVQPSKLPVQDDEPAAGTPTTMVGWGRISFTGPVSDSLLKVNLEIIDQDYCETKYQELDIPVYQATMICADKSGETSSSCGGDSGGPVYVDGAVHGIVSFGVCETMEGFPSVVTRVSHYRDWINEQTGI